MKKVILVISAIVISVGAYAQDGRTQNSSTQNSGTQDVRTQQNSDMNNSYNSGDQRTQDTSRTSKSSAIHPDGYMMENGRMVQYKGGKATQFESSGTLANGTKIMSDGTYTTSDGRKMTLKNGEHLGMDGKMVPMSPSTKASENSRTNTNLQNDKSSTPNSDGNKTNTPK